MRPQASQGPPPSGGEQKKSVFDRLGRQLDPGRPAANRRSPAPRYGEHPMHPGIHEPPPPDFGGGGRYMRGEGPPDMDWRYGRRQQHQQQPQPMLPFGRPDRHPSQGVGPPPMQPYDMDVMSGGPGREPPPGYYQHAHASPFPPGPPGPMMPMLGGPDPMAMGMHQQRRPSPKYDRHGNPIRGGRMDHPPGMSPPGGYRGPPMPGPMMPPGAYEMMPPMRPGAMYPQERWNEGMLMGPQMPDPRMLPSERFMEQQQPGGSGGGGNQRFQQQQQPGPPMMLNPELMLGPQHNFEAPRYSKWRERRDVITNLDRQTAQSSSKTDSLKSSLQHPENRGHMTRKQRIAHEQALARQAQATKKELAANTATAASAAAAVAAASSTGDVKSPVKKKKPPKERKDPQDISDGEIIDDEDSDDDSDIQKEFPATKDNDSSPLLPSGRARVAGGGYLRKPLEGQPFTQVDGAKRRRMQDRDEYSSMDYETISDEELDDFMSDKKLDDEEDDEDEDGAKVCGEGKEGKSSSEIELLNALGLDWATLVEMSKQSRKETPTTDSALRRFSIRNYLPTLGISKELAGPEIYNLIVKITS